MTARPLTLAQACAQYPNRYTCEHVPAWAKKPCEGNGLFYAPQFASDVEWYNNTKFFGEAGHMGKKSDCFTSGQTWPFGNWLLAAYTIGVEPVKATVLEASYAAAKLVGVAQRDRVDVLHEKLRNLHDLLKDEDSNFDQWVSGIAQDHDDAANMAAREYLELTRDEVSEKFRDAARRLYGNDECEFDDMPKVSPSENGAFVQAWVFVTNEQAGITSDEEDDGGPWTAVEVDGEPYEFNVHSVCYKNEADDREEAYFEFWFYHGLAEPTAEVITALIRKANSGEKV